MMVGVAFWSMQVYRQDVKRTKDRASLNAQVYAQDISKDFQRGVGITETLEAIVIEGKGQITDFEGVARGLLDDKISSIQLAPDGVVTEIYPRGGNEAGKIDLFHDSKRGPIVQYGKENNVITIQGPFELKQGGEGIAIRNPVFITDEDGNQSFWGFTIVLIKSPEIFEDSLQALENFGYEYTLDTTESIVGNSTKRISGSIKPDETLQDAVAYSYHEAENVWTISVEPQKGWVTRRVISTTIFNTLFVLLIVVLLYLLMRQKEQKEILGEMAESSENANDAKTVFLSNMAHDIRTPLNAVIGLSELAEKHLNDPKKTEYYIGQIGVAGNQLLNIINCILEITRIESGKVDIKVSLADADDIYSSLQTVFNNQAKASRLKFNFSNSIEHRYLYMDRTHVEEILVNLVSNAMKYTPEDGIVDVSFTELPGRDENHALIRTCVKDNGIGMSEEFQKKLFDKFEREDNIVVSDIQGSGLGLSIVKQLVDMMEGRIQVTSRQGLGTLVTVELEHKIGQASEMTSQMVETDLEEIGKKLAGKRILLAEDNEINATIAEDILTDEGFLVEHAENGKVCLQMLKDADEDYYDLILMDVNMPVMDGYQATNAIRKLDQPKKANIVILAMTANAFEEDKLKSLEEGMNGHISKPIVIRELQQILLQYLG